MWLRLAGNNIYEIIEKRAAFQEGKYEQALEEGFLATDLAILNGESYALCWA